MALTPAELDTSALTFLSERQLATLTTLRRDGTPHVVAVGFTWDNERGIARVITWERSKKFRNVAARPGEPAVLCQVDGPRWLSLEGPATASTDPDTCRDAVERYAHRYRPPKEREDRGVIEIQVERILGRV